MIRWRQLTHNANQVQLDFKYSGLIETYIQQAEKSNHFLDPSLYFGALSTSLLSSLREKGVELDNTKLRDSVDGELVDLVHEQLNFEDRSSYKKKKSYEAWQHDIKLWFYVQGKRDSYIEYVNEVKYWITTVDFRFINFDAWRSKQKGIRFVSCLHPLMLIEMLSFFAPETEETQELLFKSIFSLIPREFDSEAEKAALETIRVVSKYENMTILSKDSILAVLNDKALQQRINLSKSEEYKIRLVNNALMDELERQRGIAEDSEIATKSISDSLIVTKKRLDDEMKTYAEERERQADEVEVAKRLQLKRFKLDSLGFIAIYAIFIYILCNMTIFDVDLKKINNFIFLLVVVLLIWANAFVYDGKKIEKISKKAVFQLFSNVTYFLTAIFLIPFTYDLIKKANGI